MIDVDHDVPVDLQQRDWWSCAGSIRVVIRPRR
jgi:hypothetical protein